MFVTKRHPVMTSEHHAGTGESREEMNAGSAVTTAGARHSAKQDAICGRKSIKRGRSQIRDLLRVKNGNRARIYPAGPRDARMDHPKTGRKKRFTPNRR